MERRIGDRHAADEHRLEARHRCDRAGPSDLHTDVDHLRRHLFRRILVCDGKPRRARNEPQASLLREIVDLVDNAVDLERQIRPLLAQRPVIVQQSLEPAYYLALAAHGNLETGDHLHQRAMRRGLPDSPPVGVADAVGKKRKPLPRGDSRIQSAQTAGRRVPGIDEDLLAALRLCLVQRLEVALQHQDLAADLQARWNSVSGKAQGNRLDRPQVGGHVLAGIAIAASRADGEHAVFVQKADREAVELGLDRVLDRRKTERFTHTPVERLDVAVRKRVVEREHRHAMRHTRQFRCGGSADPLRRRIRCQQRWVFGFEPLQLAE